MRALLLALLLHLPGVAAACCCSGTTRAKLGFVGVAVERVDDGLLMDVVRALRGDVGDQVLVLDGGCTHPGMWDDGERHELWGNPDPDGPGEGPRRVYVGACVWKEESACGQAPPCTLTPVWGLVLGLRRRR